MRSSSTARWLGQPRCRFASDPLESIVRRVRETAPPMGPAPVQIVAPGRSYGLEMVTTGGAQLPRCGHSLL